MTKSDLILLLSSHSRALLEMGTYCTIYKCLTNEGIGEIAGPAIVEYRETPFSIEQIKMIEEISTDGEIRVKWENGEIDDQILDENYDAIEAGLAIHEELARVIPNIIYYEFDDDSDDIFESWQEAYEALQERIFDEVGIEEIVPYTSLEEDELMELIEEFEIDLSEVGKTPI